MMEVNVVPSVVLHFHGFRSSLLSNLWDASWRILIDMAQRSAKFTCGAVAAMIGVHLVKIMLLRLLQRAVYTCVVYVAFLTCEALAVQFAMKRSIILHTEQVKTLPSIPIVEAVPTLPRLAVPASIVILPETTEQAAIEEKQLELKTASQTAAPLASSAAPQPPRQLSAVRRRLAERLRDPFPVANAVAGERRRRAGVSLRDAKIRIGKAFLDPVVSAAIASGDTKRKQVDTYMVRVDCSTPDDKHMNPVVMWDFTASFEEFRKLEKDVRTEIKAKRLRNVVVPHLSSGAILFVQPELTQDVLSKRRARLQTFLDALRSDAVLSDCDAVRKFCQAF